jgi:hypothetical protein
VLSLKLKKVRIAQVIRPGLEPREAALLHFKDYVANPNLFVKTVTELTKLVMSGGHHKNELVYGLLTTRFDFKLFLSIRSDCARLDVELNQNIGRNQEMYIRGLFSQPGRPLSPGSEQAYLLDCVHAVPLENPDS